MRITTFALMLFLSVSIAFSQTAKENMIAALNESNYELAQTFIEPALTENPKDLDLFLLAGDVYIELEKYTKALEVFKRAEDIKDKPNVMRKLAQAYSLTGNHPEAVKILRELTKEEKKEAQNWLVLADVYIHADSITQAESAVARARELDPQNFRAYIVLGDIYFNQKVYELAKNNYEEALKLNPDLNESREKLAISYYWMATREIMDNALSQELYNRSLQEWNELTQKDPKSARAWFEQGKILFLSNNFVDAAKSLNNYVILRPSGSLGRWYLAQSLVEVGRCDSARTHLRISAEEIDSVAAKANLLLARCYLTEKDYQLSSDLFAKISTDKPLEMVDVRRWGQAALFAGDTNTAVEKWKQAIDMDPVQNCQLMYILGSSLYKMKRYSEAVEILSKRLNVAECKDSTDFMIYYFIGLSYVFDSKPADAIPVFKKAIENNPNFLWSGVYLADAYAAIDSTKLAEEEFGKVISTGKTDPAKYKSELNTAFGKLAGMKLDQKKFKDLENVAKDWLTAYPESEYAPLYAAIANHSANNMEAACRYYKMVLKVNPNNKTAKDNIKAIACP